MPLSSFSRRFSQRCGCDAGSWLDEMRVHAAVRRLRAGEGPLLAVAQAVGWTTVATLRRQFARVLGCGPDGIPVGKVQPPRRPAEDPDQGSHR